MTPKQFKQHRKDLGLTQKQLASELGLAKNGNQYIRMIEKGEREPSGVLIMGFERLILIEGIQKILIEAIYSKKADSLSEVRKLIESAITLINLKEIFNQIKMKFLLS